MNFLGFMLRKGRKFNIFDQSVQQILQPCTNTKIHMFYKNWFSINQNFFYCHHFFGCKNLIFQGENHTDKIQLFP